MIKVGDIVRVRSFLSMCDNYTLTTDYRVRTKASEDYVYFPVKYADFCRKLCEVVEVNNGLCIIKDIQDSEKTITVHTKFLLKPTDKTTYELSSYYYRLKKKMVVGNVVDDFVLLPKMGLSPLGFFDLPSNKVIKPDRYYIPTSWYEKVRFRILPRTPVNGDNLLVVRNSNTYTGKIFEPSFYRCKAGEIIANLDTGSGSITINLTSCVPIEYVKMEES